MFLISGTFIPLYKDKHPIIKAKAMVIVFTSGKFGEDRGLNLSENNLKISQTTSLTTVKLNKIIMVINKK